MNSARLTPGGNNNNVFPDAEAIKGSIDPDWAKPDDSVAGQVETWLEELNYHQAGGPVIVKASEIVRDARPSRP